MRHTYAKKLAAILLALTLALGLVPALTPEPASALTSVELDLGLQPTDITVRDGESAVLRWSFAFDLTAYTDLGVTLVEDGRIDGYNITSALFRDAAGDPVTLQREMAVRIPSTLAGESHAWELYVHGWRDGNYCIGWSEKFYIEREPSGSAHFTQQPNTVSIPPEEEYGILFWTVDFDLMDQDSYYILSRDFTEPLSLYASALGADGMPAASQRSMSIRVPRSRISPSFYQIAARSADGNTWYSEPFYVCGTASFTEQPQDLVFPYGSSDGDTLTLSWTVDFDPQDNYTFMLDGGINWGSPEYIKDWLKANNTRHMEVEIPYEPWNSPLPYRILVMQGPVLLCASEPFYIRGERRTVFRKLPQNVVVPEGGTAEISWSVEFPDLDGWRFPEGYPQHTGNYWDEMRPYGVCHMGLTQYPQEYVPQWSEASLIEAMKQLSGYGDDFTMEMSPDMTITVDSGWVSNEWYVISYLMNQNAANQIYSNLFYIRAGYSVTFVGNEYTGEIPAQAVAVGECALPPAIPPSIPGYFFGGWYTDSALTRPYSFTTPVNENLTLYAKWSEPGYLVSFEADGGYPAPAAQAVRFGEKAVKPATPVKEGRDFGGWYTDPEFTNLYDFDAPVTRDTTLYAKWTLPMFQVSFLTEVGESPARQRVEWGNTVTDPGPMSAKGYIFGGWWLDGEEYDFGTPVTHSFHLTAKWTKICTVSFDPGGGTGSMASATALQRQSFTAPECAFAPPEGKRFLRWDISTGGSVSPGSSFTVTDDTVLTPRWENIVYHTVTFNMNGHGEQLEPLRVERDTAPVKPEDPTAEGYTFLGWYVSGTGADLGAMYAIYPFDFTQPLTADRTVYARWQDNSVYRITLELAGEGVGTAELWINDVEDPEGPKSTYYAHPGDTVWVRELAPGIESVLRSVEYQYYDYTYHQSRTKDITGTQRFTMPSSEVRVTVIFDRTPDAHPHSAETLTHVEAREGNCMTDGWLEHWECPVCGKWFSYNDWYDRYDAVSKTEPWYTAAPGHRLGEPERMTVTEPTCETEGVCIDYYYCQNENCSLGRDEYVEYRTYVLPAAGHDWGPVTYAYVEYPDTVEARRVCRNDPAHVESEVAEYEVWNYWPADCIWSESYLLVWEFENPAFSSVGDWYDVSEPLGHDWDEGTVTTEPTCDHDGVRTYTCRRSGCGWTRTEAIPALGHDWEDFTFTWSADNSAVTAGTQCRRGSHSWTYTLDTEYTSSSATCERNGVGVYTARFSQVWSVIPDQVKAVVLPALGHAYAEPAYTWSSDLSTVTAKMICRNDASHVIEETVRTVYAVTTMPTATAPGEGTYTAAFADPRFEIQTRTLEIPKRISITAAVSGSTVRYTLEAAPAGALLIAARYDGGRQTDIRIVPVSGLTGSVTLSGSGGEFRLFLVDGATCRPLGAAWHN